MRIKDIITNENDPKLHIRIHKERLGNKLERILLKAKKSNNLLD